ncbi:ankyrin repeat domain-containing protein [Bergeyella zoohelcum]|uniref:ankyrin repeat domain-containing protein n=1 Tax=Bergeyella zoohelcum TaxID=1015 RepID=UPI0037355158
MKRIFILSGLFVNAFLLGQNKFLNQNYWKAKPTVETIKADISAGHSPSEFNDGLFDPVTLAINNDAPYETIIYLLSQDGNAVNKVTHDGRIYLHWASFRNRTELVEYLIKAGSDLYAKDTGGRTPFDFGALGGMTKATFEKYFNAGYPVKKLDNNGANALMIAAARDNEKLETTEYLISKGLSVKDKDKFGRTIVDYATRAGNVKTVEAMVKKGYPYTDQALIMAAMGIRATNSLPIFTYLIETLKINPNTTDKEGKNALHYLAGKDNSEEQVTFLLSKKINTGKIDTEGASPFLSAAKSKNLKNITALLKSERNKNLINTGNNFAQTPLMMAAQYSTPEMMEYLILNGAKTDIKDNKGNGLLYYITQSYSPRRKESVQHISQKLTLLKKNNFQFGTKNANGNTLLHLIAETDNIELMKIALQFYQEVNAQNSQGNTALMNNAMVATSENIMKLLIEAGANTQIENEFGETAHALASENEILQSKNINLSFLK